MYHPLSHRTPTRREVAQYLGIADFDEAAVVIEIAESLLGAPRKMVAPSKQAEVLQDAYDLLPGWCDSRMETA